jgi:aminoglycoside phosphotransferase (APT) family kinase protein
LANESAFGFIFGEHYAMIQPFENIQLGPQIAHGLTSEVFALDSERVVKLYLPWMRREKAEWEFTVVSALHSAGAPVPKAFEIVEINGRLGLVLERLNGISMLRHTTARPWRLISASRQMAEIHAKLHAVRAPVELPTQRRQIEDWIARGKDLTTEERLAAKEALSKIEDGDAVCHGDFHPENILFTARGPMIIDWSGGTRGNALGDVARTVSLMRRAEIPKDFSLYVRLLIQVSRRLLLKFYLRRYFEIRHGAVEDLTIWEPIQKAAISAWRARMDPA